MSAVAIDGNRIEQDLKKIMSSSVKKTDDLKRNIDFKGIAGDFFKEKNYSYTLNENGDFTIIASPGMSIIGKWEKVIWSVKVNISFDNINKDSDASISMSPASFHEYEPVFDYMLSFLKELYNTYTETTKANRSSKLLGQIVSQHLRKIKLSEASLTPHDGENGLIKLTRRIAGNLYLSTILDFENYESRCQELMKALTILPPLANEPFIKFIFYKKKTDTDWIGYHGLKIAEPFVTDEKLKMKYINEIESKRSSLMKSGSKGEIDQEIIDFLTELNFIYAINDNNLQIVYSRHWSSILCLSYQDSKIWLSENNKILSKEYEITIEELKELLKSIALASMKDGYFKNEVCIDFNYPRNNYLYEILGDIYKYRFPAIYYNFLIPWIEVFNDKEGITGFRWSGNRSNWWSISLKVFDNYETIRDIPYLWSKEAYPNISVIIK